NPNRTPAPVATATGNLHESNARQKCKTRRNRLPARRSAAAVPRAIRTAPDNDIGNLRLTRQAHSAVHHRQTAARIQPPASTNEPYVMKPIQSRAQRMLDSLVGQ